MLALLRSLCTNRRLIRDFVGRDLKARYVGSSMGFFWSVVFPIINLFVYMFVFRMVLGTRFADSAGVPDTAIWMLAGIMVWTAFSETVSRSTNCLVENSNLIQKVVFPSEVLPIYLTLSSLVNMCIGLPIVLIGVLWFVFAGAEAGETAATVASLGPGLAGLAQEGVRVGENAPPEMGVGLSMLSLPLLLGLQAVFTVGLGYFLSTLNLFLRDVYHLIGVGITVWMFATPIFYPAVMVETNTQGQPTGFGWILDINPMYWLIECYRDVLLFADWPDWAMLGRFGLAAAIMFLVGGLVLHVPKAHLSGPALTRTCPDPPMAPSTPQSIAEAAIASSPTGGSAIQARDLGKAYRMYAKPIHRVWDLILPGKKRYSEFWAVRNVYLDVPRGSTVGIIGENGAGKSTLLKLLTGVSAPTTGQVAVQGRVASLLELGAGFHPEFSGRENVFLNCSILGMTQDEIEERYPKIVEFSELGDFIERPVKTYSSGMYVRLGFAVASSVDPDILFIDEALSVGDEHFKGKCVNRLNEFREQGKTTVFVSHDMGAVKSMCQHVVLMDQGEVLEQGTAEKVADEYLKRAHARGNERLSTVNRGSSEYPAWGSGELEVTAVEMVGPDGVASHVLRSGEPFTIRLHWKAHAACQDPVFGLGMYRSDGTYVNGSNHAWRGSPIELGRVAAGETGTVEVSADALRLLHGQYYLTTFVYDHSKAAPTPIDHREHVLTFEVLDADRLQHGLLLLPSVWRIRRQLPDGTVREEESQA